jgi:hypothetical protein
MQLGNRLDIARNKEWRSRKRKSKGEDEVGRGMWGGLSPVLSQNAALQAKCAIVEVERLVSVTGGDGTESTVGSKSRGLRWWLKWVVVVVV